MDTGSTKLALESKLELDPVTKKMWEDYLNSVFKYNEDPTPEQKSVTRKAFNSVLSAMRINRS